jgi:hypothetical protein
MLKYAAAIVNRRQPLGAESECYHPSTVRFWMYHEGYVRMKLREGVKVHCSTRGPTEEGWKSRSQSWLLQRGVLLHWEESYEQDCDGRNSWSWTYRCPVVNLTAFITPDGVHVPRWELIESGQHDYSAEAMGY